MWPWAKACKGVALVAFFLPWVTVSCSRTEIVRASGWDLAVGHPHLSPALAHAKNVPQPHAHASIWLLLALTAIVAGLVAAFRPAERGAKVVVATAVSAFFLVLIGTHSIVSEARDNPPSAAIRIDWQFAYWLTLLALVATAVASWMVLTGRSFPGRGEVSAPPPA